jgi:YbbR domain-containing protein
MAGIAKSLTNNAGSKVMALLAAVALWILVPQEVTSQELFEANVRYVGVAPGFEVDAEQLAKPSVLLEGAEPLLASLRGKGLTIAADCSGLDEGGERTSAISELSLNLPAGVKVVHAVPAQLRFSLQRSVEAEVAVEPSWSGAESAEFTIEEFAVVPASLRIAGPANRVGLLDRLTTDPIDVGKMTSNGVVEAAARLPDPKLRFVDNPIVRVEVRVKGR